VRSTYVTVHNPETGESRTFAPDEDLPGWAEEIVREGNPDVLRDEGEEDSGRPVPGPSQNSVQDLIGSTEGAEDDLMYLKKDRLLEVAEATGADSVSDANTKAEIVAAIRETGYDGDGSDLE
jgi:hypothetical protein